MEYEVLRVAKVKDMGGLSRVAAHLHRERDEPHIDRQQTAKNSHDPSVGRSSGEVVQMAQERLSELRTKSNRVVALEYVIGAGHGDPGKEFFDDAYAWIHKRHGPENVLACTVHRDEQTPHMHVLVIPVRRDEKGVEHLSASHYINGRKKLSDLQTEFHEKVGVHHGLERGVKGSKAQHQDVKKWRQMVNETTRRLDDLEKAWQGMGPDEGRKLLRGLVARAEEAEFKLKAFPDLAKQLEVEKERHRGTRETLVSRDNFVKALAEAALDGNLAERDRRIKSIAAVHFPEGTPRQQALEKGQERGGGVDMER